MKKLFISVPMRRRSEENIKKSIEKMHKIAEVLFECELEVLPSYYEQSDIAGKNYAVEYLGKAIQMMGHADCYLGVRVPDLFIYSGCDIENNVARAYGIPMKLVDAEDVAPDIMKLELSSVILNGLEDLESTDSEK